MASSESSLCNPDLTRRQLFTYVGRAAAVLSFYELVACGVPSTAKNPANYHYGYWRTLAMSTEARQQFISMNGDPAADPNAKPIDLKKAVLLSTSKSDYLTGVKHSEGPHTLGVAFETSATTMEVGVLDPRLLTQEIAMAQMQLYIRLGAKMLRASLVVAKLHDGDPAEQFPNGAESVTLLSTTPQDSPISVSEMNLHIPLL